MAGNKSSGAGRSGRGASVGGGDVTKTSSTLSRGIGSTTYGLSGVPDAELQVVKRTDGYRSVASLSIPDSQTGKGLGQKMMLSALNDGPILHKGAGSIGDNFTQSAFRVRQALIRKGLAHVVTDEFGTQLLVRGRR